MTSKSFSLAIGSLLLWTTVILRADFTKKTPMSKLSKPIDFSQTVYAEAETYADVDFWNMQDWKHLDANGNPADEAYSLVTVDRVPVKVLYTINWQREQNIATVTISYDDGSHTGKRAETTNTYIIAKFDSKDVILVHTDFYGIDVLTFNGTIGSFTQTTCNANDAFHLNRSETFYGTCRN
jgi:hypothetical protein